MLKQHLILAFLTVTLVGCANSGDESNAAAPADGAAAAAGAETPAAPAEAETEAAPATVAAGDPEKGKRMYLYCQACHSINKGGMNKVGPNLHGVFGRAAAQAEGFIYSDALSGADIVWDEATLEAWIRRPSELVPGTTMVFAGIQDPQQRADLIAYIKIASSAE